MEGTPRDQHPALGIEQVRGEGEVERGLARVDTAPVGGADGLALLVEKHDFVGDGRFARRVLPDGHLKSQGSSNRARSLSGGTPNRCRKHPVHSTPRVATLVQTMKEITPPKKDRPTPLGCGWVWGQIT